MPNPKLDTALAAIRDSAAEAKFRMPPHNIEAEQALVGAIMANNRTFEKVSEFLRPEHFSDPVLGRVFEAAGKLIERGQLANPITLRPFFESDADVAERGGAQFLVRLVASVVGIVNAADYGQLVHDLFLRRELIEVGEIMVNEAYRPDPDHRALDQIERTEQKLFNLASIGTTDRGFTPFKDALSAAILAAEAAYRREGQLTGVSTGFEDLDKLLGGLHRSDFVILAGRPSMGKTALATNIAFHAAKRFAESNGEDGAVVAFFSLEMSSEQLATRILAEESRIGSEDIRRGKLSDRDFDGLVQASQTLARIPLYIDDTAALSIAGLRIRARRLKRQTKDRLGLIVIDYLQLLSASGNQDNRVLEIAEITRSLKALAKELDVPVLALSQLSRQVEMRDDKRPQLSDLRESGTIEQDSDVVMFVFREEYYLSRQEPAAGTDKHAKWQDDMEKVHNLAEVIVAKQRHGPIGKVELHFEGRYTKFSNLARSSKQADAPY
jgi:replicative DNA helicase